MKTAAIVVLSALAVLLAVRLVHVENQREAMLVGLCRYDELHPNWMDCLDTVQTRTSWMWHLWYGLTER